MFGPDGRLYIASVTSSAVVSIDPESGEVLSRWGIDEGVNGPDDLAFGPDGSVFWTDIYAGEVGRRTPDGTVSIVGSTGPGANPITFSDDGRLFVAQCFLDDNLFEIDPEGVEEPRLILEELGPLCGFNGMDWGPDGKLYGPRWFKGEVARVDVDRGTLETVASGFGIPASVKFDSQGRLHVLDTQAGEVVRVDVTTGDKEVVGRPGVAKDNMAFNAEDRLFVSSFSDGAIVEVTGPETNREVMKGGISMPGGIAFVPAPGGSGRLLLADSTGLLELDPATGAEVKAFRGGLSSDLGQAHTAHPHGEHLIVSSSRTVSIWDPDADRLVARFEGFEEVTDALSHGNDIIVSEFDTGSVLRFHPDTPDDRTVIASGLAEPAGLAVHGADVYVADRVGTVFQVVEDGETLDTPRMVVTGLAGPEGIAVAEDGALYVIESDAGRVTHVEPATGTTTVVADGLSLRGVERRALEATTAVGYLNGVAVGDGALFVSGFRDNRVYRIDF
jgi:sugar lactone lactonase YvrE